MKVCESSTIRLKRWFVETEETFWSLTLELCRKQCLYVLGILRHIADASKNLDFGRWAQLIEVFSEEGKKLLLSSCSEPVFHYV